MEFTNAVQMMARATIKRALRRSNEPLRVN